MTPLNPNRGKAPSGGCQPPPPDEQLAVKSHTPWHSTWPSAAASTSDESRLGEHQSGRKTPSVQWEAAVTCRQRMVWIPVVKTTRGEPETGNTLSIILSTENEKLAESHTQDAGCPGKHSVGIHERLRGKIHGVAAEHGDSSWAVLSSDSLLRLTFVVFR